MAVLNSVQLPDGTVYDLQDAVGNYATQTYVDNAVAGVTKGTIGLGNVDNTSDLDKPVSTATQTALNSKTNNTMVANVETTTTATQRYEIGDNFIYNGVLYEATAIIANGDTIEEDTNCEVADPITKQIKDKNSRKKYLLISDSYGGYNSGGVTYSWIDDVISLTGIDAYKLTAGSIGFCPPHDNVSSFLEILTNAVNGGVLGNLSEYTDIIVGGGANDISNILYERVTTDSLITNIGLFVSYCKTNFANAAVSIAFIGNAKSGNYAKYYYQALNAYRECVRFGATYIANSEYILQIEDMRDDGLHPTAQGFEDLAKYMSEGVINKTITVSRTCKSLPCEVAMDATVGAWNLVPPMEMSQTNGKYVISQKGQAYNAVIASANRKPIDTISADISNASFKFFAVGKPTSGNFKGSEYTNSSEVYIVDMVDVCIYTTQNNYMNLSCPLVLIQGIFYLALPASGGMLSRLVNDVSHVGENILYLYIQPFTVTVDVSNYNGW